MFQVENTGRFYQRPRQCTGSDKPRRTYSAAVLTLLYGISFSCAAEPEKHYPPYPDVWGYELPMPGKDDSRSALEFTKLEDGDYAFTYVKSRTTRQKPEGTTYLTQYALTHFFSREQKDITGDALNHFWEEHKGAWDLYNQPTARFHDGSWIGVFRHTIDACSSHLQGYSIAKRGANGKVVRPIVPLVLYDAPRKDIARYPCEGNEDYDKDYFMQRINTPDWTVLPLEDDTFLLYSYDENLILRLDKDFNSKSDLLNRRIFLIDQDIYLKITNASPRRDDQALNDVLSNYVLTLKKETGK